MFRNRTFTIAAIVLFPVPGFLAAQNPANLPAQVGPTMTATRLSVHEKFEYRIVQSFGLRGFAGAVVGAAIGQARDVPHEWGQEAGGYGTRYASGFGTNLSRQSMWIPAIFRANRRASAPE